MLKVGKVLTLSNKKEYVVTAFVQYNNTFYYSLINKSDIKDNIIAYVEEENDKLKLNKVTDFNLAKVLLPLLYENITQKA